MDERKQKLRAYIDEQEMSWQILFGIFYLDSLGLAKENFEFDIRSVAKFCETEEDYEAVYKIADFLNFHEDEIAETLQKLRFRPVSWQYDFVKRVSELSGYEIIQTLGRDALVMAYGYALITPEINIDALTAELDAEYAKLFKSAGVKMRKLKRNFMLALDSMLWTEKDADKLNFRELLTRYVPHAGISAVIKAYKLAVSPDVKLTSDEKSCLAFAYYSPFFYDEVNVASGAMPGGSVFSCAETCMTEDKAFFDRNRDFYEGGEEEDDDDDDKENAADEKQPQKEENPEDKVFKDSSPFNHLAVYVDPLQRCVIDSMLCDNAYGNVYIEKFASEKLNSSLPDFIRYHKGCLYTIEFVDNLKKLDVAQKLNYCVGFYEQKIKKLVTELKSGDLSDQETFKLESKLDEAEDHLADCYFIS